MVTRLIFSYFFQLTAYPFIPIEKRSSKRNAYTVQEQIQRIRNGETSTKIMKEMGAPVYTSRLTEEQRSTEKVLQPFEQGRL